MTTEDTEAPTLWEAVLIAAMILLGFGVFGACVASWFGLI